MCVSVLCTKDYIWQREKITEIERVKGKWKIIRKSYLHFLVFFQILKGSKAVFWTKDRKNQNLCAGKGRGNLQKRETNKKKRASKKKIVCERKRKTASVTVRVLYPQHVQRTSIDVIKYQQYFGMFCYRLLVKANSSFTAVTYAVTMWNVASERKY